MLIGRYTCRHETSTPGNCLALLILIWWKQFSLLNQTNPFLEPTSTDARVKLLAEDDEWGMLKGFSTCSQSWWWTYFTKITIQVTVYKSFSLATMSTFVFEETYLTEYEPIVQVHCWEKTFMNFICTINLNISGKSTTNLCIPKLY